jgi:glycerate kinase
VKIVIAPDSFKESLSSLEAAQAIARGLQEALSDCDAMIVPIADGGEGTVDSVLSARKGESVQVDVQGPLGETVAARYGLIEQGSTAIIEMASASGLALIPPEHRNPLKTSTYGTGELILHACRRGARRILLGIGGSATVDGGAGCLRALGLVLYDSQGNPLPGTGGCLDSIDRIDHRLIPRELYDTRIEVLCDVNNPLLGEEGSAAIFGPQKGADEHCVSLLEKGLAHWSRLLLDLTGKDLSATPGSGASGGLGYGLSALLDAALVPGCETLLSIAGLSEALSGADLVITGEGRLDATSARGKVVSGVAHLAQSFEIPTIALAGTLGPGHEALYSQGITTAFSLVNGPCDLREAIQSSDTWLENLAFRVGKLLAICPPPSSCEDPFR